MDYTAFLNPIDSDPMKTLFKAVLVLILLQACAPGKYVTSEFKNNPTSYNIHSYSVGDGRKSDEDPDPKCKLDKYSFDELTKEIEGFPLVELSKNGIKNPLLKTSFEEIASPEIDALLETQNSRSMKFAKLNVNLWCISLFDNELEVTVTGEIKYDTEILWRSTGTNVTTIPDLDINAKEWNKLLCKALRLAVRQCLNNIPR